MEPLGYKVRQKSTNVKFSVDGIHFPYTTWSGMQSIKSSEPTGHFAPRGRWSMNNLSGRNEPRATIQADVRILQKFLGENS